jgi:hypothetical protein
MNMIQKQGKGHNGGLAASLPRQLNSVSTVDSVVTKAVKSCAKRMGFDNTKDLIARIKEGDPKAYEYYNYNIAKQLGEVLGSLDKKIRAVYAYDYDDATPEDVCFGNALPVSLVRIIIWAERKTKAVDALVAALDRAMVQHYSAMLGLHDLEHVLDVQVVDDEDMRSRTGYGALLQSVYQPPIQVWCSSVDIRGQRQV